MPRRKENTLDDAEPTNYVRSLDTQKELQARRDGNKRNSMAEDTYKEQTITIL